MKKGIRAMAMVCVLLVGVVRTARGDDCSALLKDGIFDTRSNLNIQDRARSYANWFCSLNFSEASQADSYGAELGFPFEGVPVKFGFNASNQSFSQWYSSFCQDVHEQFTAHSVVEEHVRTASKDVLDAFTKCTTSDGFHVWLEYSGAPEQVKKFTLAATFRSPNPQKIPYAAITTFQAPGVRCVPNPKGTKVGRPTQRFSCARTTNDEVRIALASTDYNPDGAGDLSLPAVQKPTPPPVEEAVSVTAVNVPTDFKLRNTGQHSGCGCDGKEVYFPNGPYNVRANQEFIFEYDASPTWHGQGFDNFHGTVNWGPVATTLHDYHAYDYAGIGGTLKVKFSKPGDYNAVVFIAADCLDAFYGCHATCTAEGTTQVHVQ